MRVPSVALSGYAAADQPPLFFFPSATICACAAVGDPAFGGDIGFELSFAFSALTYPLFRYVERRYESPDRLRTRPADGEGDGEGEGEGEKY